MDDESTKLLREIRDLQIKQLELLKAALLPGWMRWRFSLRALLIVMTLAAILLGLFAARLTISTPTSPPIAVPPLANPPAIPIK